MHCTSTRIFWHALQGHFSGCTATSSTPPALSTISYTATSSVLYRTSVVRSYLACTALQGHFSGRTATSSTPPAFSTSGCTWPNVPYRTSVVRSHFRHAHRPGSYSAVRTSGMHIDQALLGLHQHTGYSRVRTGCSTPRWTIQYVSMPDGRFRANPPLPIVVWAICAALLAVAILQRWS